MFSSNFPPTNNPLAGSSESSEETDLGEVIQEFLLTTGFSNVETYLEDQFRQGINPRKAVEGLYWHLHPPTTKHELKEFTFGGAFINGVLEFHLSKEFINRWLKYPSGRNISDFTFLEGVNIPRISFENVRYLTPHPNQLKSSGFLVEQLANDITSSGGPVFENPTITQIRGPVIIQIRGPVITPIPCVLFDNQPLYIPVVRYARYDPASYEETFCGTYYYFDEGPQLYLKSNKTLIVPYPIYAFFYLNGGDARAAQLVLETKIKDKNMFTRSIFEDPQNPPGEKAVKLAEQFHRDKFHCGPEEFKRRDRIPYTHKGDFEQVLCRLGRHLGYDVIISTYPNHGNTEMFDTRSREESFANLVWRIP